MGNWWYVILGLFYLIGFSVMAAKMSDRSRETGKYKTSGLLPGLGLGLIWPIVLIFAVLKAALDE